MKSAMESKLWKKSIENIDKSKKQQNNFEVDYSVYKY